MEFERCRRNVRIALRLFGISTGVPYYRIVNYLNSWPIYNKIYKLSISQFVYFVVTIYFLQSYILIWHKNPFLGG